MRTLQLTTVDLDVMPSALLPFAKTHMHVDHNQDDLYIKSVLARSIAYFERTYSVRVHPATVAWIPEQTDFCNDLAEIPSDCRMVSAMTAAATAGDVTAQYSIIQKFLHGAPQQWLKGVWQDGLTLTLTCGYTPASLPAGVEEGLQSYATHLYEHREIFVSSGTDVVPSWILDSFATWWVPRA